MPAIEKPNPEQRLWLKGRDKFCSGFCNNNGKPLQCEGTKPRSFSGQALKTCPMWQTCPCECHLRLDEMFTMTGLERKYIPNPDYDPPHDEFVMPYVPDPVPDPDAVTVGGVMTPPDLEHPLDARGAPAAAPLASRRTDTGRAARGGLEAQVWEALNYLMSEDVSLTPKAVGEYIREKYTIPTPSSGAINAVWDRWEKIEYATQAKKPNRFLGFTGEGTWEELQRIKARTKTVKRSSESMARRGYRPPTK